MNLWFVPPLVGALLGAGITSAAVSDQCETETLALYDNSAIDSAYGGCIVNYEVEDSCTFDFSSTSAELESDCNAVGGDFYEEDVSLACSIYVSGTRYDVEYFFLNYPACFASICTEAEAMDYYDTVLFPNFESQLATQGFICNVMGEEEPVETSQTSDNSNNDKNVGTSDGVRRALSLIVASLSVVAAATSYM